MSRLAYLDCASGASGDMILGALVDLGLSLKSLRSELAKVPLGGYRIEAHRVNRSGLQATKVDVIVEEAEPPAADDPKREHHDSGQGHSHAHAHGHEHRGLPAILALLVLAAGLWPEPLLAVSRDAAAVLSRGDNR